MENNNQYQLITNQISGVNEILCLGRRHKKKKFNTETNT